MFSSRPNFKREVRELTALVQSSLTAFTIDLFKTKAASGKQAGKPETKGYYIFDYYSTQNVMDNAKETNALMIGHNGLPGTSAKAVI